MGPQILFLQSHMYDMSSDDKAFACTVSHGLLCNSMSNFQSFRTSR